MSYLESVEWAVILDNEAFGVCYGEEVAMLAQQVCQV